MHNVRRYFKSGDVCFFTHVTFQRQRILTSNIDLFWEAIESIKLNDPAELVAWVLLPDHVHLIVDSRASDLAMFSRKWKLSFAARVRKRLNMREGRVWQNRFWDHIIRDETDFNRHIDYIHFNPVKHGLAARPGDYPHSSFNQYIARGEYAPDWGSLLMPEIKGEFGE